MDRHDVQPVIQILAKPLGLDFGHQVAIAGGDDAGVDADGLRVADALELALLQHPQQLDLQLGSGGVDFVEKDRAGMGGLEPAGPIGDRPGERAADVAEQFALQQAFRQRAAIDADERPAAARAELMHRLGDQFLAGSRFAEQQHRGVRARNLPGQPIDLLHGRTRADQPGNRRHRVVVH